MRHYDLEYDLEGDTAMTNLAEGLPQQQQRVRDLMAVYRSIGNAGVFALMMMMEEAMQRADKAAASGDVVAMLRSYNELKEFE